MARITKVTGARIGLKFHDGTFYFNTSTVLSTFKPLSAAK